MTLKKTALKILILVSTGYAMLQVMHWRIGFTYFTQLSNLYAAAVVLLQLISGKKLSLLKYSAAVSIFITFFIYLTILAPMTRGGILAAYRHDHYASLCLHFITPALTAADFFLNDTDYSWETRHIFFALVPPICYLIFILVLGKLGVRWGRENMTGPYLFLNYAAPAGWFGIIPKTANPSTLGIGVFYCILILILLFLLVGWIYMSAAKKISRTDVSPFIN